MLSWNTAILLCCLSQLEGTEVVPPEDLLVSISTLGGACRYVAVVDQVMIKIDAAPIAAPALFSALYLESDKLLELSLDLLSLEVDELLGRVGKEGESDVKPQIGPLSYLVVSTREVQVAQTLVPVSGQDRIRTVDLELLILRAQNQLIISNPATTAVFPDMAWFLSPLPTEPSQLQTLRESRWFRAGESSYECAVGPSKYTLKAYPDQFGLPVACWLRTSPSPLHVYAAFYRYTVGSIPDMQVVPKTAIKVQRTSDHLLVGRVSFENFSFNAGEVPIVSVSSSSSLLDERVVIAADQRRSLESLPESVRKWVRFVQ